MRTRTLAETVPQPSCGTERRQRASNACVAVRVQETECQTGDPKAQHALLEGEQRALAQRGAIGDEDNQLNSLSPVGWTYVLCKATSWGRVGGQAADISPVGLLRWKCHSVTEDT